MLKDKIIALGVTGGIAAYKSATLCSMLCKAGADVHVLMTENATKFVTPLTFATLSRNTVTVSLFDNTDWKPGHVALADRANLFIVAPATANFIAKYTYGIADDALTTFAATFNGKTIVAPAMNPKMYEHAACQQNIATLKARNVIIAEPEIGHVACGADGKGRMVEPEILFSIIKTLL
jgi:phosphopantothenoylcysteine decarboxylase/phosphopantothenate--cysteine ligase